MGRQLKQLTPALIDFIHNQNVFFVATAMEEGSINLSPKGLDSLRVVNENEVIWLNLTGSGNETAIHLKHKNRITLMFCAFEGDPIILRLYGRAKPHQKETPFWNKNIGLFPKIAGSRQLVQVQIENVQVSCGMGVPIMEFKEERTSLVEWAVNQGDDGLKKYWQKKNTTSIDGYRDSFD
ncbi:pyridoxamine 5'-phosphate oxidase family protein [Flagellimonas allohymeniacidonis]|uniref:Pyridoxamine 5'-phosphate oxidase family protein n=1 Tax=Flagellimonas allohymeniacidonis TaxID=2517819 RepID=A0A4V2HS74_9FLAO|nr:pyridoxamine 5'-phosphate oxidase family protein [Allomuricauda hymeniacidonis]TAI46620.1 pyridoxamine 5'-phosphate oxidase family protein [Allomuricauda hymeniacidonis]